MMYEEEKYDDSLFRTRRGRMTYVHLQPTAGSSAQGGPRAPLIAACGGLWQLLPAYVGLCP